MQIQQHQQQQLQQLQHYQHGGQQRTQQQQQQLPAKEQQHSMPANSMTPLQQYQHHHPQQQQQQQQQPLTAQIFTPPQQTTSIQNSVVHPHHQLLNQQEDLMHQQAHQHAHPPTGLVTSAASMPAAVQAPQQSQQQSIQQHQHQLTPSDSTPQLSLHHRIFHDPGSRYQKIRKLRATLFGNVTLFRDTWSDDMVAVKLSSKELMAKRVTSKGKPVSENPLDEMKFMRQLNQPLNAAQQNRDAKNMHEIRLPDNGFAIKSLDDVAEGAKYVLRLVDECDDGINIWTVLEFCSEGELFDFVEQCDGRLDPELVRRLFVEMVKGVRYMHAQGVCHLDLSLENLLLTGDHNQPDLKICDFGLARFIQFQPTSSSPNKMNAAGTVITSGVNDGHTTKVEVPYPPAVGTKPGKLGYMAPEVFAGLPFMGTLCDVWSMGVILFILLTGVPPYEVPSSSDGRYAMIMSSPQGLATLLQRWQMLDKVPKDALDLVSKMLAAPDKRIPVVDIMRHPYVSRITVT